LRGGRQADVAILYYSEIASPAARNGKQEVIARSAATKQSSTQKSEIASTADSGLAMTL